MQSKLIEMETQLNMFVENIIFLETGWEPAYCFEDGIKDMMVPKNP